MIDAVSHGDVADADPDHLDGAGPSIGPELSAPGQTTEAGHRVLINTGQRPT